MKNYKFITGLTMTGLVVGLFCLQNLTAPPSAATSPMIAAAQAPTKTPEKSPQPEATKSGTPSQESARLDPVCPW